MRHSGPVLSVAFLSDDAWIASGGGDDSLKLWDVESGRCVHTVNEPPRDDGYQGYVNSIWFTPRRGLVAYISPTNELRVRRLANWEDLPEFVPNGEVSTIALSPSGESLAIGSYDGSFRVLRLVANTSVCHWQLDDYPIVASFAPGGHLLAVGTVQGSLYILETVTGAIVARLSGYQLPFRGVAFLPEGRCLVATDDRIELREAASLTLLVARRAHPPQLIYALSTSPKGDAIAIGYAEGTIQSLSPSNLTPQHNLSGHSSFVYSLAHSSDGRLLASGGQDQTVRIWDTVTGTEIPKVLGHIGPVMKVGFCSDGVHLASIGHSLDPTLRVWSLAKSEQRTVRRLTQPPTDSWAAHLTPVAHLTIDDEACYYDGFSNGVAIWDIVRASEVTRASLPINQISSVIYSPHAHLLVAGGLQQVLFGRLPPGDRITVNRFGTGWISALALSPDASCLAAAAQGHGIGLFRLLDGTELVMYGLLPCGQEWIRSLFLLNRSMLLSVGDESVSLWDIGSQRVLYKIDQACPAAALAQDGDEYASGTYDGNIYLRHLNTGNIKNILRGHEGGIRAVAYSPDGRLIASGSDDSTVLVWQR
jgi:WD40 repeat protein